MLVFAGGDGNGFVHTCDIHVALQSMVAWCGLH